MLALIGSGEYLPPIDPVDHFLFQRLPAAPRVVCLPTAAGTEGDERIGYWSDLGVDHYQGLGAQAEALRIVDPESANNPAYAERIAAANFVFLSGGHPDYLYRVMKGSKAWQAILSVHQAGGVVAGCSAGAMIMGAGFPGFPTWTPGFGLVPEVVVFPHFDEMASVFVNAIKLLVRRGRVVVGIDGSTALFVSGEERRVVGLGGVTVIRQGKQTRFTHGQEVAWL